MDGPSSDHGQLTGPRYPVPIGTQLTGGVHRRSSNILHGSESTGIFDVFVTSSTTSESIGSLRMSAGETDAVRVRQLSRLDLCILSHSRHQPRLQAVLVTAPHCFTVWPRCALVSRVPAPSMILFRCRSLLRCPVRIRGSTLDFSKGEDGKSGSPVKTLGADCRLEE